VVKGGLMADIEFAHLFPEWVLSWSLHQVCKDVSEFWNLPIVHPTNKPGNPTKFSVLFPSLVKMPMLYFETPFRREEAKSYGIPETEYKKVFWGLRPDFVIKDDNKSLILLLESKSGDKPEKIYAFPKERSYYEFLRQCNTIQNKGFYYIVPKAHAGICKFYLTENFQPQQNLYSGLICWEDFFPIIHNEVMKTVLDQVFNEIEGLQKLQEWEKNR
jgi:hypothetical protein